MLYLCRRFVCSIADFRLKKIVDSWTETAVALAHAMGRILVLPPSQRMYLLWHGNKKDNRLSFRDFFHFDSIASEHDGIQVISMRQFLEAEALTGNLRDKYTGKVTFPPNNMTHFDGSFHKSQNFWKWLRNVTATPIWNFEKCAVVFGSKAGDEEAKRMKLYRKSLKAYRAAPQQEKADRYMDNPTPVDGPAMARLDEMLGDQRMDLCVYGDKLQNEKVLHFMGDNDSGARLLVHFYTFMFFDGKDEDDYRLTAHIACKVKATLHFATFAYEKTLTFCVFSIV